MSGPEDVARSGAAWQTVGPMRALGRTSPSAPHGLTSGMRTPPGVQLARFDRIRQWDGVVVVDLVDVHPAQRVRRGRLKISWGHSECAGTAGYSNSELSGIRQA